MLATELTPVSHQLPFHHNFSENNNHLSLDLCNGGHEIVATSISKFFGRIWKRINKRLKVVLPDESGLI